jgi:predicted O-methyltransferase YrrM
MEAVPFHNTEDTQASKVDPLNYDHVQQISREFFSYESPLPKWPPTAVNRGKFKALLNLFDWKESSQLELWKSFIQGAYVTSKHHDLLQDSLGMYPDLDRVFLYSVIRHTRPGKIFEIGSGESTHVVQRALHDDDSINCEHLSIEPYRAAEVPENVRLVQQEVQELEENFFDVLSKNDILFIDSSHVTMAYGDTLTELLTILPRLSAGVLVHIHDIFLPYDYPPDWFRKNYVYTEQWLVALLLYASENEWEVVWSSHLMATHYQKYMIEMPSYPLRPDQAHAKGGSLWIRKMGQPRRNHFTSS